MGKRRQDEAARANRVAVGYLRRSTDRQEQSIPDQLKAVERYATEQGLTVERWYTDDAISGTSVAGRKAFQELITDAQKPSCSFRFVVVYDVKRFGRVDNDEAGYYRHLLKSNGVEVLYATEGFLGAETDDLLRPVKQWQARQESKDLSKVTIRGLLSRSEGGWWMGGVPPLGYDLAYSNERGEFLLTLRFMPDGSKQILDERGRQARVLARGETLAISKRDRARLIFSEPQRVETVRRIFSMYVEEGKGLTAIADALNRSGTPTPRGPAWASIYSGRPRKWCDGTVRAILVNPIYVGDMVWNRRTDARFHMIVQGRATERKSIHGARLEPNNESDWLVARDSHPAIITRKTFERARFIREGKPTSESQREVPRSVSGGWNGARARFALSGLVHCACCLGKYQGVTRTKGTPKRDGTRIKTFYYACGAYISKGASACDFNPVGQSDLESLVIETLLGYYKRYLGDGGRELLSTTVCEHLGVQATDLAAARKRTEAEQRDVEATIATLLDNLTPATRDLVEERLATLRDERQRLARRCEEIERMANEEHAVQELVHDVERFLNGLEWALRHGVPEERLTAFRRCVERVEVNKPEGSALIKVRPLPSPTLAGIQAESLTVRLPAGPKASAKNARKVAKTRRG